VAGNEELSHASERVATAAIDNAVSRPGRDPVPMSPKEALINRRKVAHWRY